MLRKLLIAFSLLFFAGSCATNPVTGQRNLALLSETQEIELGQENDPKIREQYGLYEDASLQQYVQEVGQKLAQHSHRPGLAYHFAVLDSADVNAFALPGGYIYVTRGIMAYLQSEAELAAVLGHEIGHVTARHGVRQYSAAMAANLGFVLGAIVVPELQTQAGQSLFNVLGSALLSGYGRDHELESDRLGAEYLARQNYDPDAMIEVIGALKNQELFEQQLAAEEGREARAYHGVFASHPSADQRLQEVVAEAQRFKTGATTRIAREEYLSRLRRLPFGDSEQEGIRRGTDFYHKALGIALHFPKDWRLDNGRRSLDAVSPARDAHIQVLAEDQGQQSRPELFLRQRLKVTDYRDGRALVVGDLPAFTAVAPLKTPFGVRDARISVVYFRDKAFVFFAAAKSPVLFAQYDPAFLRAAQSLHALTAAERPLAEPLRIEIITAKPGDTFAKLAKESRIPTQAEAQLRLMNAKYPDGEPQPGERIKIVR